MNFLGLKYFTKLRQKAFKIFCFYKLKVSGPSWALLTAVRLGSSSSICRHRQWIFSGTVSRQTVPVSIWREIITVRALQVIRLLGMWLSIMWMFLRCLESCVNAKNSIDSLYPIWQYSCDFIDPVYSMNFHSSFEYLFGN